MRSARVLVALTFVLATVTGCSEGDTQDAQDAVDQARDEASSALEDAELDTELPDVNLPDIDLPNLDLDQYSDQFQERLDELVDSADCSGLKEELAKAEGNDAELTRFLKEQLQELDC